MKKLLTFFLLTTVLVLSACAQPAAEAHPTVPTPPSIQTSKTPLELLTQAIDHAKTAGACTIQYGTITKTGEDTTENLHTQQVSSEQIFDWDALYTAVPNFPTNEHFLSDFCSGPVQVIPSNDGTLRYERADLNWEGMYTLMHSRAPEGNEYAAYSKILCTAAMTVDKTGRFYRLEVVTQLYTSGDQLQQVETMYLEILP